MRRSLFHFVAAVSMAAAGMVSAVQAAVVSFGSGGNTFNMEFVTIGNPGNVADTTGSPNPAGAVGYTYDIGKFEVSEDMITKYNANFGTANSLAITKDSRGTNKPATSVSWNEAARFVNWLNTSTGGTAAYKFADGSGVNDNIALWDASDTLDYDASNRYRSKRAKYWLPSYNEWYKAAYYKGGSLNAGYWDYATGSDTAPTAVASGTGTGGNGNNEAVYDGPSGPADVDQAGGLSPYGVMGLGGNAFEWEESSVNLANSSGSSNRGVRGGCWLNDAFFLNSSYRIDYLGPSFEGDNFGFRVASLSVPEPSMMVIGTLFVLGGLVAKRRMTQ
ncbi:MAG: formylglycine-generating enzyme family protein [Planctomycetota bacterium]